MGQRQPPDQAFALALARAFAGAIIFSVPLLMTMEMWALGFTMSRSHLAVFMAVVLPLLVGLSHISGFEDGTSWRLDVLDALVAFMVAAIAATVVLLLFGVIGPGMSLDEILGKICVQATAGSFGAIMAQSQLGGGDREKQEEEARVERAGYAGELLLMSAGALFLALNIAPTEEVQLLAFRMGPGLVLGLMVFSLLLMHAFVYAVDFRGQEAIPEGTPLWSIVLRFTVSGYALCLLMSAFVLWAFGRFTGLVPQEIVMLTAVLAFPASIGASAARLLL